MERSFFVCALGAFLEINNQQKGDWNGSTNSVYR